LALWLKTRGGAGCFCGTEPDKFAGRLGGGERAERLVVFVVASLIIIMHKVAWAEAYNP